MKHITTTWPARTVVLATLLSGCVWAADRDLPDAVKAVDGDRAFGYLLKQTDLGPRMPGSTGHAQALKMLHELLASLTDTVELMHFQTYDTHGNRLPPMTNIIARLHPEREKRYLFSAHWDTRPRADYDPDPSRRDEPILGANDGASGVAVLLELATVLREYPAPDDVGIDIVLFDGEDWGEEGVIDDYMLGSREYARVRWRDRPEFGINVDMVGDADLRIPIERFSWEAAPEVVNMVWDTAARLGEKAFVNTVGQAIYDDHVPLIEIGWPVINIIDFDYPYWHTHGDVPSRCSPESLASVTRVLVAVIHGY